MFRAIKQLLLPLASIFRRPLLPVPTMPKKKEDQQDEIREQMMRRFEDAERRLNEIHQQKQEIIRGLTEEVETARVEKARKELEQS